MGSALPVSNPSVEEQGLGEGSRGIGRVPGGDFQPNSTVRAQGTTQQQGSPILHFGLQAKPSHLLSSKKTSFKNENPIPFPSKGILLPGSSPGHLSQNTRGHRQFVYLDYSIARQQKSRCVTPLTSPTIPIPGSPLIQSLKTFGHISSPRTSQKSSQTLLNLTSLSRGTGDPVHTLPGFSLQALCPAVTHGSGKSA